MSNPLEVLQEFDATSYWAEEYLVEAIPLITQWLLRPVGSIDQDIVERCLSAVSDLDAADNAPFALVWALRSTGALPRMSRVDRELRNWRQEVEHDYYSDEPLDLPELAGYRRSGDHEWPL